MLSVEIFNSGYKPIPAAPGWDKATPATWPASTSTLISGDRDAVLVDALVTIGEGERLASWVRRRGKHLYAIFVTHGHGDHFLGAGPILAAFPEARLIASDQQVVDEARGQATAAGMTNWHALFPGQVTQSPATPVLAGSREFDLDGYPVRFHTIGGADGALGTVVHVPDMAIVCAGDAVYNNIHMWLWNSTPDTRKTWLRTLDAVAALEPAVIITGHKDPDAPDDDAKRVLDQSRRYLEDFDAAVAKSDTPRQVYAEMLTKYPGHGNRHTLFMAAQSQFPT